MGARRNQFVVTGLALLLGPGLAGCVDTLNSANPPRRPQINAPNVPVALVSLDGLPEAISGKFQQAVNEEAQRRQISLVQGSEAPRYKLKGYLSAYAVTGGTAITWVFDMYDTTERRAQRLDGAQVIARLASEPWAAIDDKGLQLAAASSMNDVARYLSEAALPVPALPALVTVSQASLPAAPVGVAPLARTSAVRPNPATSGQRPIAAAFDLTPTNRPGISASALGIAAQ